MSAELQLQAGGTLNWRRHLYIERQEDEKLFDLLERAEYVNVLSSRQMGKSSLMMRAVQRLTEKGIKSVTIDLAGELGTPTSLDAFYLGLLHKIARILELQLDTKSWWDECGAETVDQRLLRFFREVVSQAIDDRIVIFLDEIDATLKLPYADHLFTAIRGMYSERSKVDAYGRITFCLLGVATPNELFQNRHGTAYDVGIPLTLRDFDPREDDLAPFLAVLNPVPETAGRLLNRILHWSGGQPYLTQKLCCDVLENEIDHVGDVDRFVTHIYENLERASSEVHFQQIRRFLHDRVSDKAATIRLYEKILNGEAVPDRTTLANAELMLSGLVKRGSSGNLIVRNPIYHRLFDTFWAQATLPKRSLIARLPPWSR